MLNELDTRRGLLRNFRQATVAATTLIAAHNLGILPASAEAEIVVQRASLDPELAGFVDFPFTHKNYSDLGKRTSRVLTFRGKRMVFFQTGAISQEKEGPDYQIVPLLDIMSELALDDQLFRGDFGARIPRRGIAGAYDIPDVLIQRINQLKERGLDPGDLTSFGEVYGQFQVWRFQSMGIHFDGKGFENLLIGDVFKNATQRYPNMLINPEYFLPRPVTDQAPTTGVTYAQAGDIRGLIIELSQKYDGPTQGLLNVAWCESRFDPTSLNKSSGARGLFQFMPATWSGFAVKYLQDVHKITNPDINNPEHNTLAAIGLYKKYGPRQWSCSF